MKVTILGTGAMACLMGWRLAPHAEVTLLGSWADAVRAIREHGLEVEGASPAVSVDVRATTDPLQCPPADLLLVLVKAWQTETAVVRATRALASDGLALTLQNGLGNYEILASTFGRERAAAGATTYGATLLAPGRIRFGGEGAIEVGAHPRLAGAQRLFERAGMHVSALADRDSILWGKVIINAAINPLAALLRVPNGQLARQPHSRELMRALAEEGAGVARRLAISLPYGDAATRAIEVAEATAGNRSSMLQDVERRRRTEIDSINGAIARNADLAGGSAPLNNTLWLLVRALEGTAEVAREDPLWT